ncbi:porin family protein [Pedobacter westerhofensis]|nr:porin family protein [Pedobacter westerhofensis]
MRTLKFKNFSNKSMQLLGTAVLFMAATGSVKAQSSPDFTFGVKSGINLSTLANGLIDMSDRKGKAGFNAGIFARVGSKIYFQPELNYITFSNEYTFNSKTYTPKFKDLNVPLMVGYRIIDKGDLILRASAGPDLYYNLKDQVSPVDSKYKRTSVGGVLNVGIDLGKFTIDTRNSIGFTKLNKDFGQKPNIFSLSVGYKFL